MDIHVDHLKARIEELPDSIDFKLRLHRAVSWLHRGARETDADAKYIFLWIAFNAAYGDKGGKDGKAREDYLKKLVPLDKKHRIYRLLATNLLKAVLDIMENVYLFERFWDDLTDLPFDWDDWSGLREFDGHYRFVKRSLPDPPSTRSQRTPLQIEPIEAGKVVSLLLKLFSRLNVLRNQLMHGSATQRGSLNRPQVDAGAEILGPLVQMFLSIMVDNPKEDWGRVWYPVRQDIRRRSPLNPPVRQR